MSIYNELLETYKSNHKNNLDRDNFIFYYFTRPLSFYITVPFLKYKFSANNVTFISFIFVIMANLLFYIGDKNLAIFGALCYSTYYFLDFVDGNIARFNRKSNYFGKFIDSLADNIANSSIFMFLGLYVFFVNDVNYALLEGFLISFISLFYSFYFARKTQLISEFESNKSILNDKSKLNSSSVVKSIKKIRDFIYSLLPYVMVFFVIFDTTIYLLHIFLILTIFVNLLHIFLDLKRSSKTMNITRDF